MPNDNFKTANPSLSREERKLANLQIQQVKEKVFKLIVKIISWESESPESTAVQSANKITPKEWQQYRKHRLNIFSAADRDKAKAELNESYNSIKANGGFE